MPYNKTTFSENLNYYLKLHGENQSDLCELCGVSSSTASGWCNGTIMPRMDKVQKIADHFGCRLSDLVESRISELRKRSGLDQMTVGERIQAAREKAGLTQDQLAERSGVATIFIHQYESGKQKLRLEQIQKIADALNLNISLLISTGQNQAQCWENQLLEDQKIRLNAAFDFLNSIGRSEAIKRVEELAEIPRYRAETTPQSTSAPQEGKEPPPPQTAQERPQRANRGRKFGSP